MDEQVWVVNGTNELKQVIMCSPKYCEFNRYNEITRRWMALGEEANHEAMLNEWQTLVDAYREQGIEVTEVEAQPGFKDQIYARDFGAMVREGAIIGKFRHPLRQVEADRYEAKLIELGVPIIARCNAGVFEGGDFWMIDEHTLALGLVDRTDRAGLSNLQDQLARFGYTVVGVPCPPYNLHLDMVFNIVADKICLAATQELPYNFIQLLKRRGYTIIDVPSEMVFKHGCNVQAIGHGRVMGIKNNVQVNQALRAEGIDVIELPLEQILKGGGGPHCMTFPVRRAANK